MDVKRIGVVGTGTMGRGIAQVCATGGFDVVSIRTWTLGRCLPE